LVLLRPGSPDHPWADRRLVVEVLPGVILLPRGRRRRSPVGGSPAGAVAGRGAGRGLPGAEGFALTPVAVQRTEQGELAASAAVCRLLRPNDTVIVIDQLWMPVIRRSAGCRCTVVVPSPSRSTGGGQHPGGRADAGDRRVATGQSGAAGLITSVVVT